jgi:hypothetical protein
MKKIQHVLNLKPTQFAIGMLEVDHKIEELREVKKKVLKQYIKENPIPVIISPHGELYMVDHHHFLAVCYHMGVKKVYIKVIKDLSRSKLSFADFWKWMHKSKNVYPYCQFGEGPRKALYLPRDIRGLADDPYRSLAWFVRKAGGYDSSDKNFAEFKWANFFRDRKLLDKHGTMGLPQAMVKATQLAQSKAAKGLPGYGKLNFKDLNTVEKKAKKKGKKAIEEMK